MTLGVALALLAAACRPCARVDDAWNQRILLELAEVGPGDTPDTGVTDHARLSLSAGALAYVVAPLSHIEVFRPVARATTYQPNAVTDIVVEGEMTARVVDLRLREPDGAGRDAVLVLDAIVAIQFDAIDRRPAYATTNATIAVSGPLAFIDGERGPTLVVDLAFGAVDEVMFSAGDAPSGFDEVPPEVVTGLAAQMSEALLATAEGRVELMTWPPIDLGWSQLDLVPSSLEVRPEDGTVRLGAVTRLRPFGRLADSPPPPDGGFAIDLHPDLWRSALVHLQAVGRMPRRFDDAGAADVEGRWGTAVDAADLDPGGATVEVVTYCFRGRCRALSDTAAGEASLGTSGATIEFATDTLDAAPSRAVIDAAADTLTALLRPLPLELAGGVALDLPVEALMPRRGGVRIAGPVATRP